jgi:hypothetical protein
MLPSPTESLLLLGYRRLPTDYLKIIVIHSFNQSTFISLSIFLQLPSGYFFKQACEKGIKSNNYILRLKLII